MLDGRTAVFLSCSEAYKVQVALPFRNSLEDLGIKGIIVSEEPNPIGTFTPDEKVEAYLDASDAFVALCTPDNKLTTGEVETRQNIIDEIQRARSRPLRHRVAVFKAQNVTLPSNINPVFELLDPANLAPALDRMKRQIEAWKLPSPPSPTALPQTLPTGDPTRGIGLGEEDKAQRRVRSLFPQLTKADQRAYVEGLVSVITDPTSTHERQLVAGTLLEAAVGIDPTLLRADSLETLTRSDNNASRIAAGGAMWNMAVADPAGVPLDLLGLLCRPASEDWYVWAPALATLQELALGRPEAMMLLVDLVESDQVDNRFAAARALLAVAKVRPEAIAKETVELLEKDPDESIRRIALDLQTECGKVSEHARQRAYRRFFI